MTWLSEQAGWIRPIDLGLEETAVHAFYQSSASWQLVSIDLAYACDNVSPPWSRVKRVVFLMLLAVASIVLWTMQMEGILRYERYSHQDLVRFFVYQLRMKTRTDRKPLLSELIESLWAIDFLFVSFRHNGAVPWLTPPLVKLDSFIYPVNVNNYCSRQSLYDPGHDFQLLQFLSPFYLDCISVWLSLSVILSLPCL